MIRRAGAPWNPPLEPSRCGCASLRVPATITARGKPVAKLHCAQHVNARRPSTAHAAHLVARKQALIEGCGPAALPYMTAELRQLILDSMLHKNRRASVIEAYQPCEGDWRQVTCSGLVPGLV
jgi:hypothetical protein